MASTQQHSHLLIQRLIELYKEILNILSHMIFSRMLVNLNIFIYSYISSNRNIIRLLAFFKAVK